MEGATKPLPQPTSMRRSHCSQPPCWDKGHKAWGLISIPETYINSYSLCLSFTHSLIHSHSCHRKSDTHSVNRSLRHSPALSPSSSRITGHETAVSGSTAAWPLFHPWKAPPTIQTASCLWGGGREKKRSWWQGAWQCQQRWQKRSWGERSHCTEQP